MKGGHEYGGVGRYGPVIYIPLLVTFLIFFGCQRAQFSGKIVGFRLIEHPCQNGGSSNLSAGQDGQLYSTWIEYINDSVVELEYASLQNESWSVVRPISSGDNWFVNWADFPSLAVAEDFMAAHWLEYRSAGVYEYDVKIALNDAGHIWKNPLTPHRDEIAAEHGFVSMLPISSDQIMVFWLDGRNTVDNDMNTTENAHDHLGAMTLRTATVRSNGSLSDEFELDDRVCDCCQTSTALTNAGPVLVYRNRTSDEVRDIYIVRQVKGTWQEPHPVYVDGWKIGGCPVNGPAVAVNGNWLAVAWYTMAGDSARVKLAYSNDSGANFGEPIIVSSDLPLGRVDVEFIDSETVVVTWLESKSDDQAEILAKLIGVDRKSSEPFNLVGTNSTRASGFPKIARHNHRIFLSWTALDGEESRINTAEVLFDY